MGFGTKLKMLDALEPSEKFADRFVEYYYCFTKIVQKKMFEDALKSAAPGKSE